MDEGEDSDYSWVFKSCVIVFESTDSKKVRVSDRLSNAIKEKIAHGVKSLEGIEGFFKKLIITD